MSLAGLTWVRGLLLAGLLSGGVPGTGASETPVDADVGDEPPFPQFASAEDLGRACDAGLARLREQEQALARMAPGTAMLTALDDLHVAGEDAAGAIYLLLNVHPDKALRDAAQDCSLKWQDFWSSFSQNVLLYRKLKQVRPADPVDAMLLRETLEDLEDGGAALRPAQRQRAKAIQDRVSALRTEFDQRLRDDDRTVAFAPEELAGVPEGVWREAPRNEQGQVLLGLDYPSYLPVLGHASSAAARERMWRAKLDEGGQANLHALGEIARLRHEYARLFGFSSYADFALRRRMAKSADQVQRFLGEVKQAVAQREGRDIEELRLAKARHLQQPAESVKLERWDVLFYTERVRRERYSVDQEAFRSYFPPQQSLEFVLRLSERLFGVHFERRDTPAWHPEVQNYAMRDERSGAYLASLFVDMYPRRGKYNHAAVWSFRSGATRLGRTPQSALVVNFDRKGLTLEELETLLHEFGHALHNNLSKTRHASQSGTSVLRDFVEAPSQMLEDWVYQPDVLALFREVCSNCPTLPPEMLEQAVKAKHFGKGNFTARQHLFASYDLALHGRRPVEPLALWARMEAATPLGHVSGTRFPASFSHVAGGYAAGYYGYLWSEVIARDLQTAFKDKRLDPATGRRYRETVLANGGQVRPEVLIRRFLGRPARPDAFFEYLAR
ncbi:Zn-dependent oligopeptidase [Aquabacterium sp. A7-Y]|uniref:M3 family metallopeptidase n=1 Tax=Aquabacterium sp. A7-Y TaxID=1349605 RepID=UPI00223DC795|nr:M3 family metallopeptidase [Aquabacterium sp. A7-Y]MCW7537804.1 Zn-dependent oligopeptidase [Aquabacterium sp. A7-Y]